MFDGGYAISPEAHYSPIGVDYSVSSERGTIRDFDPVDNLKATLEAVHGPNTDSLRYAAALALRRQASGTQIDAEDWAEKLASRIFGDLDRAD